MSLILQLLVIYGKLSLGIGGGWLLGRFSPEKFVNYLGKWLFWIGIPLSVFGFVRQIDLSGQVWVAPVVAWLAMGTSLGLAWLWLRCRSPHLPMASQGSFLLISSIGNTGYLGYPISLAIAGQETFAWALFYDLLGSLLWGYGVGVVIASYYGQKEPVNILNNIKIMLTQLIINPTLWSLVIGLLLRSVAFPVLLETSLKILSWGVIGLAIILIGMRLSQLKIGQNLSQISSSLLIKMLIVPLLFSFILPLFKLSKLLCLVLVLQIAMPPAFATLIVSETYELDKDLAVSSLATGVCFLLVTLPIWMIIFR